MKSLSGTLFMVENGQIVVGVDIGGSHITAALVSLEMQAILPETEEREHVISEGSVEEIISTWAAVLESVFYKASSKVKIGIAMPGPFDYEAGISYIKDQGKYSSLFGLNVKALLADKLQIATQEIVFDNDASCFLRGEVFKGAAEGAKSAVGLTLGTGLGSATFRNGITVDANLWCLPFKDSIAEDYISSRACINRYMALSGKPVTGVKELAQRYQQDATAREVFTGLAHDLADFLSLYLSQNQAEVIVIGGNIANAWDLFIPATEAELSLKGYQIPIRKTLLAESAALMGAASLWGK